MNETARISVAMATYNGERYIRQQLDSLARQTHAPFELVITDDGSTDATLEIAADFARAAPFPVQIHRNAERLRHSENFLCAASLCAGEWIAFCDQDDVWLDQKLTRVAERIESHPDAVLIQHSATMVDEDLAPTGVLMPNFPQDRALRPLCETGFPRELSFLGFSMVFKADLLGLRETLPLPDRRLCDDAGGEGADFGHDRYVHFLSEIFGEIVQIQEPLVLYRRHASAVSFVFYNPTTFTKVNEKLDFLAKLRAIPTKKKEQLVKWESRSRAFGDMLADASIGDPSRAKRAAVAAQMYLERADLFAKRIALYDGGRIERIRKLVDLLKKSAYKSRNEGGLGAAGLVSDLFKIAFKF